MGALGVMHVMSAFFGALALKVVPKVYTFYISSLLFAIFGIKMLKEGWNMSPEDSMEEMEEVQEELRKKEACEKDSLELGSGGGSTSDKYKAVLAILFSPIFIQVTYLVSVKIFFPFGKLCGNFFAFVRKPSQKVEICQ